MLSSQGNSFVNDSSTDEIVAYLSLLGVPTNEEDLSAILAFLEIFFPFSLLSTDDTTEYSEGVLEISKLSNTDALSAGFNSNDSLGNLDEYLSELLDLIIGVTLLISSSP